MSSPISPISSSTHFVEKGNKLSQPALSTTTDKITRSNLQSLLKTPNKNTFKSQSSLVDLIALFQQKTSKAKQFQPLYDMICSQDFNVPEQQYVYDLLTKKFREIEFTQTPQTWVQKADLLDAIDAFIEKYPHYQKLPVSLSSPDSQWKEETIPLVPYSKIKSAAKSLQAHKPETKAEVQNLLKDSVVGEYTDTAKTIQKLTRRHMIGASLFNTFYRVLTKILGTFYNHHSLTGSVIDQISHFSQKMGIQSFEILSQKIQEEGKKGEILFYYRGPRYLFGQSIYEYQTVNDWFKRDLTTQGRLEYLQRVTNKEKKLNLHYGNSENGASRVVISNSDSRLRFAEIKPGHFGDGQELTGKVLNTEAEQQAKIKKDDPAYYAEKYKFNAKNLLGRETDDLMVPQPLSSEDIEKLSEKTIQVVSQSNQKSSKSKKSILKQPSTQHILKQAQHELLGGIYRAFDREGAIQVIQRLAPADIHNYVAPINGTPLSHKEASSFLKEQLIKRKNYLQKQGQLTLKEKQAIDKELAVFEQLEKVFTEQASLLGRPSQATIDIYGTNASVSTPAIQNQSRILAQNDRKVMLYKHEDGSFSLHVFIGATGVNRVDVDPSASHKNRGDRQGDMQFGPDIYKTQGNSEATKDATTKDELQKLRLGERKGSFPINGSTVISYYLPSDFVLFNKIEHFKKEGSYGQGSQRATLEIQSKMGDPILIKSEIALLSALRKKFPELISSSSSAENLIQAISTLSIHDEADPIIKKRLSYLKELWTNPTPSYSDSQLKERFQHLVETHLNILHQKKEIALENNITEEESNNLEQLEDYFTS